MPGGGDGRVVRSGWICTRMVLTIPAAPRWLMLTTATRVEAGKGLAEPP